MEQGLSKLILIGIFISSIAFANTKVIYLKGDATVNNEKLKVNKELKIGQIIKTGDKSLVILKVNKLMKVKINQNSSFEIKEMNVKKRKASLFLKAGSVFLDVQKNEKNRINLKTKSAVMGVRGTKFFTAYGKENKDADDDLWMCVKQGKVEIKTKGKSVIVNEGEGVFVEKGNSIGEPKPFKWTQNLNWEMDTAKDVSNKVNIKAQYDDLEDLDYD